MVDDNENLPYMFDCYFDLKTKGQLKQELADLQERINNIKFMMEDYQIQL